MVGGTRLDLCGQHSNISKNSAYVLPAIIVYF